MKMGSCYQMELTPEQMNFVDFYCEDELRELKKICLPLISLKGVAEMEIDDLLSDAMKTLLETVEKYDHSKNDNFGAYLTINIKRSYSDWTRDRMRDKRINYARDKDGNIIYEESEDGNGKKRKVIVKSLALDGMTPDGVAVIERISASNTLEEKIFQPDISPKMEKYLHNLSKEQLEVAELFMEGYQQQDIMEILNISQTDLNNRIRGMKSYRNISILF